MPQFPCTELLSESVEAPRALSLDGGTGTLPYISIGSSENSALGGLRATTSKVDTEFARAPNKGAAYTGYIARSQSYPTGDACEHIRRCESVDNNPQLCQPNVADADVATRSRRHSMVLASSSPALECFRESSAVVTLQSRGGPGFSVQGSDEGAERTRHARGSSVPTMLSTVGGVHPLVSAPHHEDCGAHKVAAMHQPLSHHSSSPRGDGPPAVTTPLPPVSGAVPLGSGAVLPRWGTAPLGSATVQPKSLAATPMIGATLISAPPALPTETPALATEPPLLATPPMAAVDVLRRQESTASRTIDRGRWAWFNASYKQRSDEFKKLFKDLPEEEKLLVDYSCAMHRDLLVQGRLYISQNWVCFYANIFRWETTIAVRLSDVTTITKCNTAKFIPNGIQLMTAKDRYLFSSFVARDQTYLVMFRAWLSATSEQPLSNHDLWSLVGWLYQGNSGDDHDDREGIQEAYDAIQEAPLADASRLLVLPPPGTVEGKGHTAVAYPAGPDDATSPAELESLMAASPEGSAKRARDDQGEAHAAATLPNIVTDSSDSSDNEDSSSSSSGGSAGPTDHLISRAECPGQEHTHRGAQFLDGTYNCSTLKLFELLFTDSAFFAQFLHERKTTNLVTGPWMQVADTDGMQRRTLTYTLAINAAIGPKSSPATEVQTVLRESKPAIFYSVDAECLNSPTLPYGDSFLVLNKYCIVRVSEHQCRLRIHSDIVYKKSVFGFVKGIIQRNVNSGMTDYSQQLSRMLAMECQQLGANGSSDRRRPLRRRVRSPESPPAAEQRQLTTLSAGPVAKRRSSMEAAVSADRSGGTGSALAANAVQLQKPPESSLHTKAVLLQAALLLLFILNVLVFCMICRLESKNAELLANWSHAEHAQERMVRLLQQHKSVYGKEAEHWRSLLESSGEVIYKMQRTLEELKSIISTKLLQGSESNS